MSTITEPYKANFTCASTVRNEDGDCIHDGLCEWTWQCSACGRDVSAEPCPEHAPREIPGLRLIECEKGCPRTWVLDDDGYEPPCPWCARDMAIEAHEGCEHSHHGRWRRWRIVHRALSRLYVLGIVKGWSSCYSAYCRGCAAHIHWGRSGYLLGWPRWKWRCLLVARHWPGEEVLRGMCGKCCPWPCCGSQESGHKGGCPEATP